MSDALPGFGPQARSAAIAAGACVLLGAAGAYLYPRSGSSATHEEAKKQKSSKGKAAARRASAQDADEDDASSASSSPKRSAVALSSGPPALNPVAIFWDVDNCAPPTGSSGRAIVQSIRKAVQSVGPASIRGPGDGGEALAASGPIVSFKAYLEMSDASAAPSQAQVNLRSELQGCGVSLIDTPKSGRKDVADKMLITDMLAYAIDQPSPARIVLISGDRDMAYPLGCLRNRSYSVLLITPPVGAPPILEASANVCLRWRQDVLGVELNGYGRPYAGPSAGLSSPAKRPTAAPVVAAETPKGPKASGSNMHLAAGASSKFITGPGGQPVAPVFAPLVQVLEDFRKDGKPRPLRTSVSIKLLSVDSQIYQKAGAAKWSDYAAVAEAAGYITLGSAGQPGTEWVALRSIAAPGSPLHGSPIAPATPATPAQATPSKTSAALRTGAASAPPSQPKFAAPDVPAERPKAALPARAESPVKQLARPASPVKRPSQQAVPTSAASAAATSSPLKKSASNTGSSAAAPAAAVKPSPASPAATVEPLPGFTLADFEKLMPCQPSRNLAPVPFFPLANFLTNARKDGKNVVPAETIRKFLMTSNNVKHNRIAALARSPDAWQVFVQRAQEADVVVIDASSPEMAMPLRLHPRLVLDKKPKRGARSADGSAGAATESDDSEDEDSEEAAYVQEASAKDSPVPVEATPAAAKDSPAAVKEPPAAVKDTPAARAIAPLPRSGTATPEAASGGSAPAAMPDAPARARANYKPLVTVLVRLRKETGQREVLRSKVGLEVVRINPAASAAEWYAAHGAPEGFRQYTQQAQEAGFIRFSPRGTQSGYEWIALADRYEHMFFSAESAEEKTSE